MGNETDDLDVSRARALIEEHDGNLTSLARSLSTTRQALTRRLERATIVVEGENITLAFYAEQKRAAAGIKGPRTNFEPGTPEGDAERVRLIQAVADAGGYRTAARLLGISSATMARKMRKYAITPEEVERRRSEQRHAAAG